jgi:phosphoglycolate phosphatase
MRAFGFWVFDLDGTLIDSRRDIADAANDLLTACGLAPLGEERIGRMVGDGAAVLVARAFAAYGIDPPPDALPRFLTLYDARLTDHTRPYPGIVDTLTALRSRGSSLALLTNKPHRATTTILDRLELARFFEPALVVGGDGPLPRKPDPRGLQALMARSGADAASTLLVGDSVIDWKTAHAAATSICVAKYGFGFEDFPVDRLGPADFWVESPADLLVL